MTLPGSNPDKQMDDEKDAVIDQLEAEVKILTAELAQAHANIDQLLAELKRHE